MLRQVPTHVQENVQAAGAQQTGRSIRSIIAAEPATASGGTAGIVILVVSELAVTIIDFDY